MKWLIRSLLVAFLIVGMLLSSGSVVYADDGEEDEEDPEDGLKVDIEVVGENAVITLSTTGTEIYLSGQNINEPTVIRKTRTKEYFIENSYDDAVLKENISNIETFLEEAGVKLDMTGNGLAKVILVIGEHTDSLDELLGLVNQYNESAASRSSIQTVKEKSQDIAILQLNNELLALENSLKDQELFLRELEEDFNEKLVWTWGSVGVFGLLLLGIWRLWQVRLRQD